jgi:hypothetical protein
MYSNPNNLALVAGEVSVYVQTGKNTMSLTKMTHVGHYGVLVVES